MSDDAVAVPTSALAAAWLVIDRVVVAAVLDEIDVAEAASRMSAALTEHLGLASLFLDGHHPSGETNAEHVLIGNFPDGTAKTLVVPRTAVFGKADIDRLKRLYEALILVANPLQRSASLLHVLRNRLTAIQANVEFAEELLHDEARGDEPVSRRAEMLVALGHAKMACDGISRTLGAIEGRRDG
jgi:hypothetical protein